MIAVLFNQSDVRLGEVQMPDACRLIAFGGAMFVRTDGEAVLDAGGLGVVFESQDRYVISYLDIYNPRSPPYATLAGKTRGKAVQTRPPAAGEFDEAGGPK